MSNHPSNKVTEENLHDIFTFHAPLPPQIKSYAEIRNAAEDFARVILENCPDCADRSVAIRKIRETVMVANASIALA